MTLRVATVGNKAWKLENGTLAAVSDGSENRLMFTVYSDVEGQDTVEVTVFQDKYYYDEAGYTRPDNPSYSDRKLTALSLAGDPIIRDENAVRVMHDSVESMDNDNMYYAMTARSPEKVTRPVVLTYRGVSSTNWGAGMAYVYKFTLESGKSYTIENWASVWADEFTRDADQGENFTLTYPCLLVDYRAGHWTLDHWPAKQWSCYRGAFGAPSSYSDSTVETWNSVVSVPGFDNGLMDGVIDAYHMFAGVSGFTGNYAIEFRDAKRLDGAFWSCGITGVDRLYAPECTYFGAMFEHAPLTYANIDSFSGCPKIRNLPYIFHDCTRLSITIDNYAWLNTVVFMEQAFRDVAKYTEGPSCQKLCDLRSGKSYDLPSEASVYRVTRSKTNPVSETPASTEWRLTMEVPDTAATLSNDGHDVTLELSGLYQQLGGFFAIVDERYNVLLNGAGTVHVDDSYTGEIELRTMLPYVDIYISTISGWTVLASITL